MNALELSILSVSLFSFTNIFIILVSICHFCFNAFLDGQLPRNEREWFDIFTWWWWLQAITFILQSYFEGNYINILKVLPGLFVWLLHLNK
jgi:hypothetical protein